jgi:hypothetical protein
MCVSILRCLLSWVLLIVVPSSLLGQNVPDQQAAAILHAQGGVWVNGYEARDSSAIFPGDTIETKSGATGNLVLDGSTVLLAPETVGKFQADVFELDHGSVSVGTTKRYKVRVNCLKVVPVANEWTQYVVTDVNRTAQVAAHKLDVNVEHEGVSVKPTPENESSQRASVREGEEKSFDESQICGPTAKPASPMSGVSPKWIAAGAAGTGILIWVLVRGGGGSKPVSASQP